LVIAVGIWNYLGRERIAAALERQDSAEIK